MENKIPTNKGLLSIAEIFSELYYSSYKANRQEGMSHESLVKIGIGTDEFKTKYETETITANN